MDDLAVFCNKCVPAGGVEDFTIGFLNPPKCDRCGRVCGSAAGMHVGSVKHLWPRPIPVSERLPEDEQRVLAFGWEYAGGWVSAGAYDNYEPKPEDFDWAACLYFSKYAPEQKEWCVENVEYVWQRGVTHWLPLPPKPE